MRLIGSVFRLCWCRTALGGRPRRVSHSGGSGSPGNIDLESVDRWWRAANYLSVGQIYLLDNPLLERPLASADIKPRLLGHWGTCPGINLLWAHLNRAIRERELNAMFVCGPGHGGPAAIANAWLDGTYAERYPEAGWNLEGMAQLFRQFSFPGGVPSHVAPQVPGSIHEGGELGYALAHAYGASFDAPGELVVAMVGDGEAETGPTAASWHSHRFINPATDGAVLPVLHLNGWKIANPTVLARMPESQLLELFRGYGYEPHVVSGHEPAAVHEALAGSLDSILDRLAEIADAARGGVTLSGTVWPMLVLRTPKGWTGPRMVDGQQVEGTFRSHQVPVGHDVGDETLLEVLEEWMRSYGIDELFTTGGAPVDELRVLRPDGDQRMSARPRANAGEVVEPLLLPEVDDHSVALGDPPERVGSMGVLGGYLRDTIEANPTRFRLFGPDEVASNRLSAVFEVTDRMWTMERSDEDVSLSTDGRVMEVLSEHLCQGWLEGYLLTGRHGIITSYEAFVHIVDSMFNQHAKWIDSARDVGWRQPVPSLTYLLSSHVWRQDHNGFSHQDPGFLDVVANKKPDIVRIQLPPDANTLLVTMHECLAGSDLINVVVAGKQPEPQYLDMDAARAHCRAGMGIWSWAGNTAERGEPDVVLGCAGDVPTMETLAAAEILDELTDLSVQVVNVIDLMALHSPRNHPHGTDDDVYDQHFPPGIPTLFAFHGYPWLVHRLSYKRANHDDMHVHGYREEGTTTTPFDMLMRNRADRFNLALAAMGHLPEQRRGGLRAVMDELRGRLAEHRSFVREVGRDPDEIREWNVSRT